MFASLARFVMSTVGCAEEGTGTTGGEDARLAVCALLLEVAYADAELSEPERAYVEGVLRHQYGLDAAEARHLVGLSAAVRDGTEVEQLTSRVAAKHSAIQIAVLAQIMWDLTHCDGHVSSAERYLLRKICFRLRASE